MQKERSVFVPVRSSQYVPDTVPVSFGTDGPPFNPPASTTVVALPASTAVASAVQNHHVEVTLSESEDGVLSTRVAFEPFELFELFAARVGGAIAASAVLSASTY